MIVAIGLRKEHVGTYMMAVREAKEVKEAKVAEWWILIQITELPEIPFINRAITLVAKVISTKVLEVWGALEV